MSGLGKNLLVYFFSLNPPKIVRVSERAETRSPMLKLLFRIVAVLLIPALLWDPAFAVDLRGQFQKKMVIAAPIPFFSRQTLGFEGMARFTGRKAFNITAAVMASRHLREAKGRPRIPNGLKIEPLDLSAPLSENDVQQVKHLLRTLWFDNDYADEQFNNRLALWGTHRETTRLWVARDLQGEIQAYISLLIQPDFKSADIGQLLVDRDWQAKGIGTALVETAMRYVLDDLPSVESVDIIDGSLKGTTGRIVTSYLSPELRFWQVRVDEDQYTWIRPSQRMLNRFLVPLLYDALVAGVAWTILKFFTRLVIPEPIDLAIYVLVMWGAQMASRGLFVDKRAESRAEISADAFGLSRAWIGSAVLLIGGIGLASLVFSNWAFRMGYGGHYIDYHDVWAWLAATFGIVVTSRVLQLWHRDRFWKEWSGLSVRPILNALWFSGVVLLSVGLFAGIAHFILHEDLFYNVRCFLAETPGGLALLGIWKSFQKWALRTRAPILQAA